VVPSARYVFVVPLHNCADDTTLNDLGNQPPSAPVVASFENALWDDGIAIPLERGALKKPS
tara:strand:- start:316 stop:498 length:183 start_codon:yes stop_codon:yes gene_type:complete